MTTVRRRIVRYIGLVALLAGAAVSAGPAGVARAAVETSVYAAPSGSGVACSVSAPCSLSGAQARARLISRVGQTGDVRVVLRGGTYRLASTMRFGPVDSGTHGFRVSYVAAPGETPVLTGARRLTGFALVDPARNIWKAAVPAGTDSRQLVVDGVRAERARSAPNPAVFTATATGFVADTAAFAAFTNQSDVEVVQNNKWKQMRCPLSSITANGNTSVLTVQPACWNNNNLHVVNRQFPFNGNGLPKMDNVSWIENAYQLLTQPGQFYLDRRAGALYYIPRPGESMTTADVELPILRTLVSVQGTPGHLAPVDDTDSRATYSGAWSVSSNRGYGDFDDGVHVTTSPGAAVTVTFTGTGLDVVGETNPDGGPFTATVDGRADTSRAWTEQGSTRLAQQVVYSVQGLSNRRHTVELGP